MTWSWPRHSPANALLSSAAIKISWSSILFAVFGSLRHLRSGSGRPAKARDRPERYPSFDLLDILGGGWRSVWSVSDGFTSGNTAVTAWPAMSVTNTTRQSTHHADNATKAPTAATIATRWAPIKRGRLSQLQAKLTQAPGRTAAPSRWPLSRCRAAWSSLPGRRRQAAPRRAARVEPMPATGAPDAPRARAARPRASDPGQIDRSTARKLFSSSSQRVYANRVRGRRATHIRQWSR